MKEKILKLIKTKPKHYVKLVKADVELMQWVQENSLISDSLPAMIYSAIYQVSNICPNGNIKKFNRFSTGFVGCGTAATCRCTAENISIGVKTTKSNYSTLDHTRINQKRQETMVKKYGVEFNSQRQDIKHIWTKHKIPDSTVSLLENKEWLNYQYNHKQRTLVDIADELGIYYSTVAEYCKSHGFTIRQRSQYSLIEKYVSNFLTENSIAHEMGNWSVMGNREIDIYIPSHQLAIEIDGLYWHSWCPNKNTYEQRNRHLEKTQLLAEKGIELIHITDYEWNSKTNIIQSIIKSKLGLNARIPARKCKINPVGKKQQREFLDQYHLQGYTGAAQAWGLYFNNELVQLITLGKSRFDKSYDLEVIRFCSKGGFTVVGGLSKLMNHIKILNSNKSLITYCDASKSQAKGYVSAGFELVRRTGPGYFWTDGNTPISRQQCQKKKLQKWLANFDPIKSESENMFAAGYRRFWDCGNFVLAVKQKPAN